jgi:UDP-N-acetylmuramate dehydrogenase
LYFKKIDFSKYSSLKIGTNVDVAIIEQDNEIFDGFIVGGAFNLLVSNNPQNLLMLGKQYDFIRHERNSLFVGAATMAGRVYSFAKQNNLAGFEFLSHLPGTIGGLIAMNAGMKEYEIFGLIKRVRFQNGWLDKSQIKYEYRKAYLPSVALEVELDANLGFNADMIDLFAKMRANQPKEPSAGSFFKNPSNDYAGRLIEAVGLKGHIIGGAQFSEKHANFLINIGNATFDDAVYLTNLAKKRVFEEFSITLASEVKII